MSALQRLPDLVLTDHNGNARRLSEPGDRFDPLRAAAPTRR